jgi:hypothetical protein
MVSSVTSVQQKQSFYLYLMVSSQALCLYCYRFCHMDQVSEKLYRYLSQCTWLLRVYNKNLSSQCNLTAQIEQVQDKDTLYLSSLSFNRLSFINFNFNVILVIDLIN